MQREGYDDASIEDAIDRLADQQVQEEKDRAIEARLKSRGYDPKALDQDNPHTQWMSANSDSFQEKARA